MCYGPAATVTICLSVRLKPVLYENGYMHVKQITLYGIAQISSFLAPRFLAIFKWYSD